MTRAEIWDWLNEDVTHFAEHEGNLVVNPNRNDTPEKGYIPLIRSAGGFYHVKVESGVSLVDYDKPAELKEYE